MTGLRRTHVVGGKYIGDTAPSRRIEPPSPRSTTMPNNLTEADEADHRIIYQDPGKGTRNVRAAYVTTEDKHPDMLAFKDHRNRTVLLVNRESVLAVERLDPEGDSARTEITEGGFEPTSQAMKRAGIKPQDVLDGNRG